MKAEDTPSNLAVTFEIIRGFLDLKLFEDALRELDDIPMNARRDLGYFWMRIHTCLGLNRHTEAIKLMREFLCENPDDLGAWLFLADIIEMLKGPLASSEILAAAISHHDHPVFSYELAARLCEGKELLKGRAALSSALGKYPEHQQDAMDDPRFGVVWEVFSEETLL